MAAVALLLFALLGTFLLWQISDRVDNLERGGGSGNAAEAPLPPPSGNGGRALIREFDDLSKRIERPLGEVVNQFERSQLDQIAPVLGRLERNTSLLPQTVSALNELILQTGGLGALGNGLAALNPNLLELTGGVGTLGQGIPGLARGLDATRAQLSTTVTALAGVDRNISTTNDQLKALLEKLTATIAALDRTRKSIDETNECLARPVLCGATPRSSGASSSPLLRRTPRAAP